MEEYIICNEIEKTSLIERLNSRLLEDWIYGITNYYTTPKKHPIEDLWAVWIDNRYINYFTEEELNTKTTLTIDWIPIKKINIMITRNLIPITNHPLIDSVTRKALVRLTKNDYEANQAKMHIKVFHYSDDVEIVSMEKEIILVADDSMINPLTFEYAIVDEEGNYPANSVSEFTFLYNLVASKVKNQFELEELYIPLRIDAIDKKLYNL